jgi:hypothetical protein
MPRHRLIFAIDLHRSGNSPCKRGTRSFAPITQKSRHRATVFDPRSFSGLRMYRKTQDLQALTGELNAKHGLPTLQIARFR